MKPIKIELLMDSHAIKLEPTQISEIIKKLSEEIDKLKAAEGTKDIKNIADLEYKKAYFDYLNAMQSKISDFGSIKERSEARKKAKEETNEK